MGGGGHKVPPPPRLSNSKKAQAKWGQPISFVAFEQLHAIRQHLSSRKAVEAPFDGETGFTNNWTDPPQ